MEKTNLLAEFFSLAGNQKIKECAEGEEPEELKELFKEYFDKLIILCEMEEFSGSRIHEALAFVREGIFIRDTQLVRIGLNLLKKLNETEIYDTMLKEWEYYEEIMAIR